MRHFPKRILAGLIVTLMLISAVPLSAVADTEVALIANAGITDNYGEVVGLNVIEDAQSTLAPGVTLNEIVAFDKNNKRVEMYVTTVDTTVDTVQIYANYMDNQISTWGLQTLSEQVAAMENNYDEPFTVVAGINASYYNTTTGKPTGAFVMEGIDVTTESEGNNYAFFAVLKDGTYMIGNKGEYSSYKGQIKEAIGGWSHIVKDGAVASGLDKTTKYPRQTIGLTKDGKVILMTADGSQTQTVGLTIQEQAEVMLAMGCEDALHLDGGNSATFGGIREGTSEFVLLNSPSGLAERAVSNTLCIVSTAVADGTFSRAAIAGEHEYFVPGSTYTFTAKGIDAAGGPAEIPADVEWALSDSTFGTIADGTFVSNGKTGNVAIQMVYGGKVVGTKDIHVVTPTSIVFDAEEKTIPYSKSASIAVQAMYNLNEVYSVASDYEFVIADANAGTIDGFTFNATNDEKIKSTTVTATYKYAAGLTDTVSVKFGKGSDVLFDFEDGDISDWHGTETIFEWIEEKNAANPDAKYPVSEPQNQYSNGIDKQTSNVFLASAENGGKVKNGQYSLGFSMNHKNVTDIGGWLYNYLYYTGETKVLRDVANGMNGIRIGMWVYSPEVTNTAFRICRSTTKADGTTGITYKYMKSYYDEKNVSYATNYAIPETGWIYVYYDLTDLADNLKQTTTLYDPNNNNGVAYGSSGANYYPAFLQLFTGSATDTPRDVVYYIDDITIDYSDVTDDRNAPSITDTKVSANIDNFVALNGQTVNNNCLSFEATIAEVVNSNATGLDYSTGKIYIDGIDVSKNASFKCAGQTIALSDIYLNNGKHNISFEIADKQGNVNRVTKTLTVAGESTAPVVSIVGRNESGATPKAGSVYYADINTTDASKIESVKTTLRLDLTNSFEYENIVLAPGVEAEYEYDELDRELTVTLTTNGKLTGAQTLASVPVRVWSWDEKTTGVTADKQFATGAIPTINIELKSIYGSVTYVDGTFDKDYICGVSGDFKVATELDNKTAWHKHTATAVVDKPATCTEAGYTGRTYCDGCKSIIDWGTTVEATGHKYAFADGVLKCACGELFNGEFTDGKTYVDGVAVGGWVNDSYYADGVKYIGICEIDGYYYNFGEDGVCAGKTKYTGLVTDDNGTRYAIAGSVVTGWQIIDGDWYYFDPTTTYGVSGEQKIGVITYEFEESGKLTSGVWAKTLYGTRYYYGPDYYNKSFQTIDGKEYYFENGYRLEGGWQLTVNISNEHKWYYFDENGVYDKDAVIEDGFYTDRNGYAYAKDGEGLRGLQDIDGTYYYFDFKGYALKGNYAGRLFGDDFKAITGIVDTADGPVYYKNGRPNQAGLIKIGDDYYFAGGENGKLIVNEYKYVWKDNGLLPAREYHFGPDGKMLNGIVEREDGVLCYYETGVAKQAGLICIDGDYYFVEGSKGEIVVDQYKYIWKDNGLLPAREYWFGPDGKMLDGIVEREDGVLCYYETGVAKQAGLICIDGDYYFAGGPKGELTVNEYKYIWKDNGLLPAREYWFGPDGKMLDGIVERDGKIYYYETGVGRQSGLVLWEGDYYFVEGAYGEVLTNEYKYIWKDNGLLPKREYWFGPDGKMLDGIVERDGQLYYYETGVGRQSGLVLWEGDYYFVEGAYGEVLTNQYKYIWKDNGLLPKREYWFGADGKMLNGIVEREDGKLCYYETGVAKQAGLIEWEGNYYFVEGANGEIVTDQVKYVWKPNGILPAGEYEFDAEGKMLNGFITKADGLYYYVNGKPGMAGLNYIDGYYYFMDYSGKLSVNKTQWVWKTNGLSIEMNYKFDELGRAIL